MHSHLPRAWDPPLRLTMTSFQNAAVCSTLRLLNPSLSLSLSQIQSFPERQKGNKRKLAFRSDTHRSRYQSPLSNLFFSRENFHFLPQIPGKFENAALATSGAPPASSANSIRCRSIPDASISC